VSAYVSCNKKAGNLRGRRRRAVGVIVLLDTFGRDVVVSIPRNVDKIEVLLHVCGHPHQVAGQLFTNVFLKSGSLLTAHFLYLCVGVAR
jgi:hypothetical protein